MPRPLKAYIAFVILAAVGGFALYVALGDLSRSAHEAHRFAMDMAFFLVAGCLLDAMIVPMAQGGSISAGFAAFFAALLVLGPAAAAISAAVAVPCSALLLRRKAPVYKTAFNVASAALAVLVAGAVYYQLLGGEMHQARLTSLTDIFRLTAAAATMFVVSVTAATRAVALERGIPMGRLWLSNLRQVLPVDACLAGLGVLVAILYVHYSSILGSSKWAVWVMAVVVLAVPPGLLFYASRLYLQVNEVYEKTLERFGSLIEVRLEAVGVDAHVRGHGRRVAELAAQVARELRLSDEEVRNIRYAGHVHDMGMVSLSADDLQQQWGEAVGAGNSQTGCEILESAAFLKPVATLVLYHERHFDDEEWRNPLEPEERKRLEDSLPRWRLAVPKPWTSWYRPPADALFLGAQILHAAEYYDLCRARQQDCLRAMESESGARFDPQVVQAMLRVLGSRESSTAAAEPAHAA